MIDLGVDLDGYDGAEPEREGFITSDDEHGNRRYHLRNMNRGPYGDSRGHTVPLADLQTSGFNRTPPFDPGPAWASTYRGWGFGMTPAAGISAPMRWVDPNDADEAAAFERAWDQFNREHFDDRSGGC